MQIKNKALSNYSNYILKRGLFRLGHYEFLMTKVESVSATTVKWTFDRLFDNWLDHNVVTVGDGQLFGKGLLDYSKSVRGRKLANREYSWVAEAVPENFDHGKSLPIYLALTSFSEEMLMDALRKQNPEAKMIQVIKPVDELTPPPVIKAKFPGIKNK